MEVSYPARDVFYGQGDRPDAVVRVTVEPRVLGASSRVVLDLILVRSLKGRRGRKKREKKRRRQARESKHRCATGARSSRSDERGVSKGVSAFSDRVALEIAPGRD